MSGIQFYGLIKKPIDYDTVRTVLQISELQSIIFNFELTEGLNLDDIRDICETSDFKDWEWINFILELAETGDYALLKFFCRGLSEREARGLPDSEIGLERLVCEAQLLKALELLRTKFPAIEILKIGEESPPSLKFLVMAEEMLKRGTSISDRLEKEQSK